MITPESPRPGAAVGRYTAWAWPVDVRTGRRVVSTFPNRKDVKASVRTVSGSRIRLSPYLRMPVANGRVFTKARWCSLSHHSSFRYDFPAEALIVRLSRASASGLREETVM
ncbi:hypothetical protein RKD31_003827 [Streptomyces sp. SAI-163]